MTPHRVDVCRYITHPHFYADHVDYFIICDAAQALVRWLKFLHPFVLAARPIEDERRKVNALRLRVGQKQGAGRVVVTFLQ